MNTDAGRSCPLHYRYAPSSFARSPELQCEVLYVVGGLYGNEPALDVLLALFERERGPKRLVFNGDFNWFNTDPAIFKRLNERVLAFDAMRGNVETELSDTGADDAGCGCAYPDWVGEGVVQRSNNIMRRLRETATHFPEIAQRLAALPMHRRVNVGDCRVAIVHGDAESLAGWGFAQEHLQERTHRDTARRWFEAAQVDVFASSHTCLPVFHTLPVPTRRFAPVVLNNGAAGMPNFRGDAAGLLTRIALRSFDGSERHFGLQRNGIHMDAIAIEPQPETWRAQFLHQWPEGSDAHLSYWERITHGPAFEPANALITSED